MMCAALEEEDDTALDSACELTPAVAALANAPRELDTVAALTPSLTEDENAEAAVPRPVVLALQDLFFFFFSPPGF